HLHTGRDEQQDKANQANGLWVSRYRLLLLEDKSGFPRKAAMNLLKAMIAAAKADGHVDEQEMSKIEQAIVEMRADTQLQQLVKNELHKPLDPAAIAQLATTPEQASELYLASLLVADEQNFMEKAYLNELAKQLRLADDLVLALEQQANA
uniref:tellurite resistance TerB family protein n=1 Tax=Vibrio sp. S12_S33 TaxID=2720223 RepID=UPI001EE317EB